MSKHRPGAARGAKPRGKLPVTAHLTGISAAEGRGRLTCDPPRVEHAAGMFGVSDEVQAMSIEREILEFVIAGKTGLAHEAWATAPMFFEDRAKGLAFKEKTREWVDRCRERGAQSLPVHPTSPHR